MYPSKKGTVIFILPIFPSLQAFLSPCSAPPRTDACVTLYDMRTTTPLSIRTPLPSRFPPWSGGPPFDCVVCQLTARLQLTGFPIFSLLPAAMGEPMAGRFEEEAREARAEIRRRTALDEIDRAKEQQARCDTTYFVIVNSSSMRWKVMVTCRSNYFDSLQLVVNMND